MPRWHTSVRGASAWSHTVRQGHFLVSNPINACSQVCGREWLDCHTGCQEVSRCHSRGEYQRTCNTYASAKHEWFGPLWLWNPDDTSLEVKNRGISGSTKKDLCHPKIFFNLFLKNHCNFYKPAYLIPWRLLVGQN